jgi:sugar lactone lactonase YvrE
VLEDGVPDGVAMDREDHLWIAIWGAGEVHRYGPSGSLVSRLTVPALHTSSVAFAGSDLTTLVITTASTELSEEQLRQFPDSGRLFLRTVDVPGLAVPPWSGSKDAWPTGHAGSASVGR